MSGPRRDHEAVAAILTECASVRGNGKPYRCRPSKDGEDRAGSEGKIIYLKQANAEDAARRFTELDGKPSWPYRCPYSRRGHWHLTSMRTTKDYS